MPRLRPDAAARAAPAVCMHPALISRQLLNRLAPFVGSDFDMKKSKHTQKER